jgi:hypothetical protein
MSRRESRGSGTGGGTGGRRTEGRHAEGRHAVGGPAATERTAGTTWAAEHERLADTEQAGTGLDADAGAAPAEAGTASTQAGPEGDAEDTAPAPDRGNVRKLFGV